MINGHKLSTTTRRKAVFVIDVGVEHVLQAVLAIDVPTFECDRRDLHFCAAQTELLVVSRPTAWR